MSVQHSILGASSSHRWFECPGSVAMSEGMPNESSVYAREGNAAHWVASEALENGHNALHYMGMVVPEYTEFTVDEEMCHAVQQYLNAVRAVITAYEASGHRDAELDVEVRFDLRHIYPDMFGTCDAAVYLPAFKTLYVFDYKHGYRGVVAERNKQTMYYGLGALTGKHNRPIEKVVLCIVQPRSLGDANVKEWSCTPEAMLDFRADLIDAAERTKDPDALVAAGAYCGYCPGAPKCPVVRRFIGELIMLDAQGRPVEPEKMTPDHMREVKDNADVIAQWLKNFNAFALKAAREGNGPTGMVLVEGRSHRKWKDPEVAEAALEMLADIGKITGSIKTAPELKSPAQIEALCADEDIIRDLWIKPQGGLALVPDTDNRKKVKAKAEDEFSEMVALL